MDTVFSRNAVDKGIQALTKVPLGGNRVLRIETGKWLGKLACRATVVHETAMGFTHNFFGDDADFTKVVLTQEGRCSAKVIAALHEAGMTWLDDLKAEVASFYAARDAKGQS